MTPRYRGGFARGLAACLLLMLLSLPAAAQSGGAAPPAGQTVPTPDGVEAPTRHTISPVTFVAFAIGGVGIFVGSIAGVVALNNASTIRDQCDGDRCPADQRDAIAGAETAANVSNVMFAIGGAGVIAGVIAWFVGGSDEPPRKTPGAPRSHVAPVVGPGYLGVSGSF